MRENLTKKEESFLAKWLDGTISDVTLKELVSEQDFMEYKKIKNGLELLDELNRPVAPSFNALNNSINKKRNFKNTQASFKWGLSIAASILVVLGCYFAFNSLETSHETSYGEQRTISLPDGSEVVLNAKSVINFTEKDWETNRSIQLVGEAFFKVIKGSTFSVQTSNGQVNVLGTQFNVKHTDAFFEVVCYKGKVSVTNNKKEYLLNPGNAIRKINGTDPEKYTSEKLFPSWVNGESSFVSVPLKYVILELEKQYNIDIDAHKIDDSIIFTGSFSNKDLKLALTSVFKTMNIQYIKDKNGVLSLE
ncbi:MAG: FecR family protein [Flavobacteriaceae bacterium]|jgi:transmembrane sensor|nr:FecR family protein [Flavobacteriaceae bacterium]